MLMTEEARKRKEKVAQLQAALSIAAQADRYLAIQNFLEDDDGLAMKSFYASYISRNQVFHPGLLGTITTLQGSFTIKCSNETIAKKIATRLRLTTEGEDGVTLKRSGFVVSISIAPKLTASATVSSQRSARSTPSSRSAVSQKPLTSPEGTVVVAASGPAQHCRSKPSAVASRAASMPEVFRAQQRVSASEAGNNQNIAPPRRQLTSANLLRALEDQANQVAELRKQCLGGRYKWTSRADGVARILEVLGNTKLDERAKWNKVAIIVEEKLAQQEGRKPQESHSLGFFHSRASLVCDFYEAASSLVRKYEELTGGAVDGSSARHARTYGAIS